jgi:hypothetical protein
MLLALVQIGRLLSLDYTKQHAHSIRDDKGHLRKHTLAITSDL